ncbi:hypothetical protein [Thalassovita mangrovi]|uniref:Uncharacterized protein n=1 Tax=Thalassovita mangrovi TaxID=2692236 RepID=A0A6L8LIT2_9RHOB|nr:hypothetical protein [Thalassovita mangrovi]MYM55663.1 hypothetical protein [Thalassovita mangrovi]
MKLVIATAAFALTAVSAASAAQNYAADTVMTRSVPAASYQEARENAVYPSEIVTVTVGHKSVLNAVDSLSARDQAQIVGDSVNVYTFASNGLGEVRPSR